MHPRPSPCLQVLGSERHYSGRYAVPLPHELSDDIVPDSTTVVGDVESFIAYIEYGHAWQDWCGRVQQCVRWIAQDFGPVSDDIVQNLLQKP